MKKHKSQPAKRGKKPQPKITVPGGWWTKLVNFCQAKKGKKTDEEIYKILHISRRTIANSRKSNTFTESTFNQIVSNLCLQNQVELLDIMRGDTTSSTGSSSPGNGTFQSAKPDAPCSPNTTPAEEKREMERHELYNPAVNERLGMRYIHRGQYKLRRGDYRDALADFDKAVHFLPANPATYYLRARVKCEIDDLRGALEDFKKVNDLDPQAVTPYCKCYNILRLLKDDTGALFYLNKVIELESDNALAFYYRSTLRKRSGDHVGASTDMETAIKLDPTLENVWCYEYSNLPSIRGNVIDINLLSTPQNSQRPRYKDFLVRHVASFLMSKESLKPQLTEPSKAASTNLSDANALNKRALSSNSNDIVCALKDINRAIELKPENAEFYRTRSIIKAKAGDLSGAIADCDTAIKRKGSNAENYFLRGNEKEAAGDTKGAMADYDLAISMAPTKVNFLSRRCDLRNRLGDFDGAIADMDILAKDETFGIFFLRQRALAKATKGDLESALADANMAIERSPQNSCVYDTRSLVLIRKGDIDGAISDMTRAIERDACVMYYVRRGTLKLHQGDANGALDDFNAAIRRRPDCPAGYYYRALGKLRRGKFDEAKDDFIMAYELLNPNNPNQSDVFNQDLNCIDTSIIEYSKNIEAESNNAEALFLRGQLRDVKGDSNHACDDLRAAVEIIVRQRPGDLFPLDD